MEKVRLTIMGFLLILVLFGCSTETKPVDIKTPSLEMKLDQPPVEIPPPQVKP